MQTRTKIALVGIPGSGKSLTAAALCKEMLQPATFFELRDESWQMSWEGELPDIFIFIETIDTSGKQDRMKEDMIRFADKNNRPFLLFRNINLFLTINTPILNIYIEDKIAAHRNYPDERRQYWEDEFEEACENNNFTWAMDDPMALEMFFDKTRDKSIPLSIASITSMIARCIENNLLENVLRQILEFSKSLNITGDLYLRRVKNIDYLILASTYGFSDPELTKRIINMQRIARKQEPTPSNFSGRLPGNSSEYYGYRHAMYFVRYNPLHRLKLFKRADYGNCNWQAYLDVTGDEIPEVVCEHIKRRV